MDIKINAQKLKSVASVLERGLPSTSVATEQDLVNFKFENNNLILAVASGIMHIKATLSEDEFSLVEGGVDAQFALNGKLFFDLCKKAYTDLRIVFREGSNKAKISFDGANVAVTVAEANPQAFYQPIKKDGTKATTIPLSTLLNGYNIVGGAVEKTTARPSLTGIAYKSCGGTIEIAGCDSFRLHTYSVSSETAEEATAILSPKLFLLLQGITEDCNIEYTILKNSIHIKVLNFEIVSLLQQGNYFNYRQLISASFKSEVAVDVSELKRAIDLVSLSNSTIICLDIQPNSLWLISSSKETRIEQEIKCNLIGSPIQITLNSKFLSSAIKAIKNETVQIKANSATAPLIFTEIADEFNALYLLIPLRDV